LIAPWSLIWTLGIFVPMVREIRTTRYQFTEPFIMDSRRANAAFGHQPEPLENPLRDAARRLKK
jgi:nucleoside-diphosphate-sugar epimerase